MADDPLHKAFDNRYFRKIEILLSLGTNPNCQDASGLTLLMKCAYLNDQADALSLTVRLIENGASTFMSDNRGKTALFHAASKNRIKMVKLLLNEVDEDLNRKDKSGSTVLHLVAERGHYQIACQLVSLYRKYHTNIDIVNRDGMTALHVACARGHYDIAKALVYGGNASLSVRDDKQFLSAREWLTSSLHFSPELDPFPQAPQLRKKWAMSSAHVLQTIEERNGAKTAPPNKSGESCEQTIEKNPSVKGNMQMKCKSAHVNQRARHNSDTDRCKTTLELKCYSKHKYNPKPQTQLKLRIKSAPSTLMYNAGFNYDPVNKARRFSLAANQGLHRYSQEAMDKDTPVAGKGSFFQSASFRCLFELYAHHSSPSYRPPAIPPAQKTDHHHLDVETTHDHPLTPGKRGGMSRSRMQRAMKKVLSNRQMSSPTPSISSTTKSGTGVFIKQAFSDPGVGAQHLEVPSPRAGRRRSGQSREGLRLNLEQLRVGTESSMASARSSVSAT